MTESVLPDPPPASLRRRTGRAAVWSLLQNGAREGVSFVTFILLARFFLTSAEFGLMALASSIVILAQFLARAGLHAAVVQRPDLTPDHLDAAFWAGMILALGLGGTIALLAPTLAAILDEPRLAPVVGALAAVIVLEFASMVHVSLLTRALRFRPLATRTFVAGVAGGAVALTAAALGAGVWSLVALVFVKAGVAAVLLWRAEPWRPRLRLPMRALRELAPLGVHVSGLALVNFVNGQTDKLLVGAIAGAPALGVYYAGQRMIQAAQLVLTQAINGVAMPAFAELRGDLERARRGYLDAVRICAAATFPAFIGMALVSDSLVRLLLGEGWDDAALVLGILCVGAAPSSLLYFNQSLMVALGTPAAALRVSGFGAVLLVVLCAIGSLQGAAGVAAAVALKQIAMHGVWSPVLRRRIGLTTSAFVRTISGPLVACTAMAAAVALAKSTTIGAGDLPRLVIAVGTGAVTYAAVLGLVDRPLRRLALGIAGRA